MRTLYIDINNKPVQNTDEIICVSDNGTLLNDFFYELGCSILSKSGINVPKAQLISGFNLPENVDAYAKIMKQWEELKAILFGNDVEGEFNVHLPKEYMSWLGNHSNQEYRTICRNKSYDCTKELIVTIDLEEFYDEYVNDDFIRFLVKTLRENNDIEQIVFNDDVVTRKSQIVNKIKLLFEKLSFIPFELWSKDVTDTPNSCDTNKLCIFEDSEFNVHTIDSAGNIDSKSVPMWGCYSWTEDTLYKVTKDKIEKICNFHEGELGVWNDFLIVNKDWESPSDVYTKDGQKHFSSGKFHVKEPFRDNLFICKISHYKVAIVDIVKSKIIRTINYPIFNRKECCAYSLADNTLVFALDNGYEHLEFLNIKNGHSGTIDYSVNYERRYRNEANPTVKVVNDNCLVYSNGKTYSNEEKYVMDFKGNILHIYTKYWPNIWDMIIYSSEGGMYNSRSGRSHHNWSPEFRVNDYLLVTEKRGKKFYKKIVNYENDKLIMDLGQSDVRFVLGPEDKIKHIVTDDGNNVRIINVETKQSHEIMTPLHLTGDYFCTENGIYINITGGQSDENDNILNFSTILDKDYNVVADDVWGNYIGMSGMTNGIIYYLKSNGEFGCLNSRKEQILGKIENLSNPIFFQPLYKQNKFIIWCEEEALLINASCIEENRSPLTDIKEFSDVEKIDLFEKVIISFSSFLSIIYENETGLVLNFASAKTTSLDSCYKIHNDSFKLWNNLVIYDGINCYDGFNGVIKES